MISRELEEAIECLHLSRENLERELARECQDDEARFRDIERRLDRLEARLEVDRDP